MGMAASQARLLTITARMHDVEYQAQSIQNAKIALSTQEDQVYQAYLAALDATTLTVKDYKGNVIPANFNNLCGTNAVQFAGVRDRYMLTDEKGRVVVPDDVAEDYEKYKKDCNTSYDFALYMMTGGSEEDVEKLKDAALEVKGQNPSTFEKQLTDALKAVYSALPNEDGGIWEKEFEDQEVDGQIVKTAFENARSNLWNSYLNGHENDNEYKDAFKHYNKLLELERSQDFSLYKGYGEEIFEKAGLEDLYAEPAFWAYVSYFEQIQANGGRYVSISEFNGINGIGNANSDGDWLQDMTKAGKLTIDVTTFDGKGNFKLASTSVATEASLEYTTTTTIDKAAYAKAEAEYEHKMKEINQKDKKFDMDLSKLETERTALKTEYDSVKKVIQDNIERTFGIFS